MKTEQEKQEILTAGDLEKELRSLTSEQRASLIRFLRCLKDEKEGE